MSLDQWVNNERVAEAVRHRVPVSSMAIVLALVQGYEARPSEGVIVGKSGRTLSVKLHPNMSYPTVRLHVSGLPKRAYSVYAHKVMAYAIFGVAALLPGSVVRHGQGGVEDIRTSNLSLGSYSDNELDKPAHVRRASAQAARAAQPRTPYNALLTKEQAQDIRNSLAAARTKTGRVRRGVVKALAQKYSVSPSTISIIGKGKTWAA
jgi:hypothetical protein